jgi:hypothetical protein
MPSRRDWNVTQLSMDFSTADAVTLAVRAFGFVSGDAAFVKRLLAGSDHTEIPRLLTQHAFLARVLDAVINDENILS